MRTVRSAVRFLGLLSTVLLAAAPVLVLPAVPAAAQTEVHHQSSRTGEHSFLAQRTTDGVASEVKNGVLEAADSSPLAISITGMSPQVATPKTTITIHGTLANHTGSALSGIVVQADTGPNFGTRSNMDTFGSTGSIEEPVLAGSYPLTAPVPNGATVRWSISFAAGNFYTAQSVSVYPLTVQVSSPVTASAHTMLPYDPGNGFSKKLQVAWVWPLDDPPQQGACAHTLPSSGLNGLVSAGGRLSTLLDAGAQYTGEDDLTWDIDPSLLSDVSVMKGAYFTGGSAACSGRFTQQPSQAATSWLTKLQEATAGQEAFLTPYANVDVAALSHAGLDASIRSAYQVGRATAAQVLPPTFGAAGTGTTGATMLRAAWPPDGRADAETVTSLASDGGVSTVVVAGAQGGTDNAIGRTMSGIGTSVSVLSADSEITGLLGSATPRDTAKDQFALVQDYLADTAMIVSDFPGQPRSLVVAPPTDWDPTASEAKTLLFLTHEAPWLHSVGLSALAAEAQHGPATHLAARQVSRDELSPGYLGRVQTVDDSLDVFKNLLYQPLAGTVTSLTAAGAATVSSSWRGTADAGGLLTRLSVYLRDSEHAVQIIASKKILLTGTSGDTPVSVVNGLNVPIQVQVEAMPPTGSQLQLGQFKSLPPIPGGKTGTVRIPIHSAAIGTTTVQLQLVTQNGSPLGGTVELNVEVTRFGRSLLIIVGAALGILVLTSAVRLRRKRRAGRSGQHGGTANDTAEAGGTG